MEDPPSLVKPYSKAMEGLSLQRVQLRWIFLQMKRKYMKTMRIGNISNLENIVWKMKAWICLKF